MTAMMTWHAGHGEAHAGEHRLAERGDHDAAYRLARKDRDVIATLPAGGQSAGTSRLLLRPWHRGLAQRPIGMKR